MTRTYRVVFDAPKIPAATLAAGGLSGLGRQVVSHLHRHGALDRAMPWRVIYAGDRGHVTPMGHDPIGFTYEASTP